ncbi:hypothetical protein [Thalassomonas haliotis]|uniref:Response regulatory domain-containing protein n=1 Tax=Thalassomonas haliotis TaxID=485448 RepID=A0ABY7V8S8_9GAMM|nr:hypothetical protein [Thalassomonas haliotis]WDE09971.1 hypothetical protein H3N35_16885 [Thalassomonas haliotis]
MTTGYQANKTLKILILNTDITAAITLKKLLLSLGKHEVVIKKDARYLAEKKQTFAYDLIIIQDEHDFTFSGPDLIRYFTRKHLVPIWCKFVLLTSGASEENACIIFRHLRTEILPSPLTPKTVQKLIAVTQVSLSLFQPVLKNLHSLSATVLVKQVSTIDSSKLSSQHKDELLLLKIKLLFLGAHPELAWQLTSKINHPGDKYREQLFISFTSGQKEPFIQTLRSPDIQAYYFRGYVYYATYLALMERKPDQALATFSKLDTLLLRPNEMDTYALLVLQSKGLAAAVDFIRHKQKIKSSFYYANSLSVSLMKIYVSALISDDSGALDKAQIVAALDKLLTGNTFAKGSFKFDIYEPFIKLGMAILTENDIKAEFEQLYKEKDKYDVIQLNILLYFANKMALPGISLDIHKQIEKCYARLEMSPELLSFKITHKLVLQHTMSKSELIKRHRELGNHHWHENRRFRALRHFQKADAFAGNNSQLKLYLLTIMSELGINGYWDINPAALIGAIDKTSLSQTQQQDFAQYRQTNPYKA